MKITFQRTDTNQNVERQKMAYKEASVQRIGTESGYALDISGTVMDNEIYKSQGKTMEEVMQEAGGQNVALAHDYMAVMSNCMSDGDFAKLQEDGYQPGSTEVEKAVTIIDKIKASLLQAGVSVAGYTDTLDMDTLTEITGNSALAEEMAETFSKESVPLTEETAKEAMQALEDAKALKEPEEDTMKYMVLHEKEPVLQDLYMAQYSSLQNGSRQGRGYYQDENGYLTRKADQINWESLQSQIDSIIEEAGLEDVPQAEESARWLVEAGIPLTKETLTSYMGLQKISIPAGQQELLQAMATAVSDGRSPREADLTGAKSLWEQAIDLWNNVQQITDAAADLTAEQGKSLTLHHLDAAQKLIDNGYQNVTEENAAARRMLEEIRLQMTISANRELLKSGYAIETSPLEEVIEALKSVEQHQNEILFGGEAVEASGNRAQLYEETREIVSGIPQMPAAVVGRVCFLEEAFTLHHVKEVGKVLAGAYERANERYETFQTMPRSDMGDSLAKAFRNAEALLEEIDLEATEANKRAVRILGYNSLEITEENIEIVKEADQALKNTVKKLSPAATLQMIREGKNPLTMTVAELDDYLSERQQEPEEEQEKYSKFLYKLEQKKEITKEEKESYIGIYRLLRQVEKSDGAVIGSLIHQGAELSFRNLLTAVRTSRARGMDTVVDDGLGTLQEVKEKSTSIDEQIETAFREKNGEAGYFVRLSHEVYDNLEGDKIVQIAPDSSMDLEAFAEMLRQTESDEQLEEAYKKEQIARCRQIPTENDNARALLTMLEEPVTFENMQAASEYGKDSAKAFAKIKEEAERQTEGEENALEREISSLEEHFDSKEEAIQAYRSLTKTETEILDRAIYESTEVSSMNVKELGLIYKQISFTAKLADRERYDIPIITKDSVMALHVQIVHSHEDRGSVEASMELEGYGELSIKLQVDGKNIKGFFIGSQEGSQEKLQAIKEEVEKELSRMEFRTEQMNIGFRKGLHTDFSPIKEEEQKQVSTNELYRVAKAVIVTVHREAERG